MPPPHLGQRFSAVTSAGSSVGYNVAENMWVSVGYNLVGFSDRDFSAADDTSQGVYLHLRFKFDQNMVKEALALARR